MRLAIYGRLTAATTIFTSVWLPAAAQKPLLTVDPWLEWAMVSAADV
jgi:hypothetical protein